MLLIRITVAGLSAVAVRRQSQKVHFVSRRDEPHPSRGLVEAIRKGSRGDSPTALPAQTDSIVNFPAVSLQVQHAERSEKRRELRSPCDSEPLESLDGLPEGSTQDEGDGSVISYDRYAASGMTSP